MTHCDSGCGVFGGCGGSCSVSGRALLCACPPSTLQGKRNTSTHSSWTQPPLEVIAIVTTKGKRAQSMHGMRE